MRSFFVRYNWLVSVIAVVTTVLAIGALARTALILWLDNRVADTGGTAFILLQGVRFDLVVLGLLLSIPVALSPVVLNSSALAKPWLGFLRYYLLACVGSYLFLEVATPPFIGEYDVRPNFLFVEYLRYPAEVLPMLWANQKLDFAAAGVLLFAVLWPLNQFLKHRLVPSDYRPGKLAIPIALVGCLVCFGAVRSTLDHRPVNPSTVAFSNDSLVNTLPLNSLYSVLYAIYELRHEDSGFSYGERDPTSCTINFANATNAYAHHNPASKIPSAHWQQATYPQKEPKNLVIIVEESLGAEFVGKLGGLPLTPNLDRLANQGVWFEQMYATGTRSARGLEAIVSGFPPTTSQSVLKLGRAQRDFFTLGSYLKSKGYDTSFIYGGEAQFDNMQRFFANNGFDHIVDKHDFVDPIFFGSWGASDEDVFTYLHNYLSKEDLDKPKASVVFTTSNHSPWEFPDDRIALYEQPKATVNNAVKYADHALGQFFDLAMQSDYWKNTVFLVVADHNSRVRGAELVPIEFFHIPALILGGGIDRKSMPRRASQIDLFPTLMSYIGISGNHPAVGIDLTRPDLEQIPERATMQYGDTQAYWVEDQVVILRKDKTPAMFDYINGSYTPAEIVEVTVDTSVCNSQWPVIAYRQQQYRTPHHSLPDS